jgi:hypothetical protein
MDVHQLKAELEALGDLDEEFTVVGNLLVSAGHWATEEGNLVDYGADLMIRVWPGQGLCIELVWSYPYQVQTSESFGKATFDSVEDLHTFIFEL